jgi:hypothetical protein
MQPYFFRTAVGVGYCDKRHTNARIREIPNVNMATSHFMSAPVAMQSSTHGGFT